MRKRKPKEHVVKTWTPFFEEIVTGMKTAELRLDDRGYQVGDRIRHREFHPGRGKRGIYTGHECVVLITGKLDRSSAIGMRGLKAGWCMLSIKLKGGTEWKPNRAGKVA